METNNNMTQTDNGKTVAILSYFWFVGWLIAYFAFHKDNKTQLGSYHLRQTLLFHIIVTIVSWGLGFLFALLFLSTGSTLLFYIPNLIQLAFFVIWIIALIGAINGQEKPIFLIGEKAQTMFPTI